LGGRDVGDDQHMGEGERAASPSDTVLLAARARAACEEAAALRRTSRELCSAASWYTRMLRRTRRALPITPSTWEGSPPELVWLDVEHEFDDVLT
jgi:hypothetical protein